MKSILLAGATLMIGASIYGIVDYSKTRNKKEFKNMYTEPEVTQPVAADKPIPAKMEKPAIPAEDKNGADEKVIAGNTTNNGTAVSKINKHKKRKFKPELFSRGALDEKYIPEAESKPESPAVKKEAGSSVKKGSE